MAYTWRGAYAQIWVGCAPMSAIRLPVGCSARNCATRGHGLYLVSLKCGAIREYTRCTCSRSTSAAAMSDSRFRIWVSDFKPDCKSRVDKSAGATLQVVRASNSPFRPVGSFFDEGRTLEKEGLDALPQQPGERSVVTEKCGHCTTCVVELWSGPGETAA